MRPAVNRRQSRLKLPDLHDHASLRRMSQQDEKSNDQRFLTALTVVWASMIAASLFIVQTTAERLSLTVSLTIIVVVHLVLRLTKALSNDTTRRFFQFGIPVTGALISTFSSFSPMLQPLWPVLTATVGLWNILRRPRWLALVLTPFILVGAMVALDSLQPEPPPDAGVYELHLPGAGGLRWDLDLHTNFFGNFDRATSLLIENQSWSFDKPAGVKRLLCLGTSQALAGAPIDRLWCHLIGSELRRQDPAGGWQVINTGLWGGDDLMQWIYYDHLLRRLQPDILVVSWSGLMVPPYGSRMIYPRLREIVEQCENCDWRTKQLSVRLGAVNPARRWLKARYYSLRSVKNIRDRLGLGRTINPRLLPPPDRDFDAVPDPKPKKIIRFFLQDREDKGYALFFIPEINRTGDHSEPLYYQMIAAIAPDRVLDVRPAFTGIEDFQTIFADSHHLNELGHRLQGEYLAKVLINKGIF